MQQNQFSVQFYVQRSILQFNLKREEGEIRAIIIGEEIIGTADRFWNGRLLNTVDAARGQTVPL